jgi:hypothetical protein
MSETIRLSEHVKLSNVSDGLAAMADRERSMIYLWDCGPSEPKAPVRPKAPKGQEGEPEYDLAMVEFRRAIIDYEEGLKTWNARKIEYAQFLRQYGGPYEIKMWSVDARDALERDALAVEEGRQDKKRYCLSARTRGYSNLPNGGLPLNMKPGHGHAENMRREREGEADTASIMRSDPVFGGLELTR